MMLLITGATIGLLAGWSTTPPMWYINLQERVLRRLSKMVGSGS